MAITRPIRKAGQPKAGKSILKDIQQARADFQAHARGEIKLVTHTVLGLRELQDVYKASAYFTRTDVVLRFKCTPLEAARTLNRLVASEDLQRVTVVECPTSMQIIPDLVFCDVPPDVIRRKVADQYRDCWDRSFDPGVFSLHDAFRCSPFKASERTKDFVKKMPAFMTDPNWGAKRRGRG